MTFLTPLPSRMRASIDSSKVSYSRQNDTIVLVTELRCPKCESEYLTLYGYPGPILYGSDAGEIFYSDPISIRCNHCAHIEVLFDEHDGDGYNAVIGAVVARSEPLGTPHPWLSDGTGKHYRIEVAVTYDTSAHQSIRDGERYDDAYSAIAFSSIDDNGKKHNVTWFETA